MSRIAAIMGGGDWYDASVTHLIIPDEMNLESEKKDYVKWDGERRSKRPNDPYISFDEWLIQERGVRRASESEVEEFWE